MYKLLILLIFLSCATTANYQKELDRWVGKTMPEVTLNWGKPQAIVNHTCDAYGKGVPLSCTDMIILHYTVYQTSRKSIREIEYLRCDTKFIIQGGKVVKYAFSGDGCKR